MFNMLLAVSIFATVVAVLVLVSFRDKPNATLSMASSENFAPGGVISTSAPLPLMQQMKLCWHSKEYIFASLGTSGIIVHMYVFTTLVGQLVIPYGITEQKFVVDMGLVVFGVGILGGVLNSMVQTCYPGKLMTTAYVILLTTVLSLAFFNFADIQANKVAILVACGFHGFFLLPILMVAYELAVEQTAHLGVGESMSCGLINMYANTMGFVVAISLTPALSEESTSSALVTFAVLFVNLAVALFFLIAASMFARGNKDRRIE